MSNFDLIQLLESENEAERKTAAEALGKLVNQDAVPALLKALDNTNSVMEAVSIVQALGKLQDSRAVAALFALIERSSKWRTSMASSFAVEHLHSNIAEALGEIADTDALIERLHHPHEQVRRAAANALGNIRII